MASILWLIMLAGAVALIFASNQKVDYWQKTLEEDKEQINYQKGVLKKLRKGRKPSTKCPYSGWDSYHCYCVGETEGTKSTTTNSKRKRTPDGLYCLDEDGRLGNMNREKSEKSVWVE